MEWKKPEDAPMNEALWVIDAWGEYDTYFKTDTDEWVDTISAQVPEPQWWMEPMPAPKKEHFCSPGPLAQQYCKERDGMLFYFPPGHSEGYKVDFCPFCGESANKENMKIRITASSGDLSFGELP